MSTDLHHFWHELRAFEPGSALFQQLESLHIIVIDPLEKRPWDDVFPPKMNSLRRLSIAMGSQVVITSHLRGEEQQELSDVVQGIDDRFSVVPHRSDSSESERWTRICWIRVWWLGPRHGLSTPSSPLKVDCPQLALLTPI
ncbi:hypothetical protein B0H14DRAFT_3880248 [Mycena olivaceomarginata]|nr:hypothetical protein B0H14DRAFT_3880248 [Mycena olivaceomarginata]